MTSLPLSTPLFVVIALVAIVNTTVVTVVFRHFFCNQNNRYHCLRQLCSYLLSLSPAHHQH